MSMLTSLIFLVLCTQAPPAIAGGGSSEFEGEWYLADNEYSYVEVLILIVLVILAIAFDTIWHSFSHRAADTYAYGDLHDLAAEGPKMSSHNMDAHGNVRHKKMFKELTDRTGAEFMTLGFLAFVVFIFNQVGGFEKIAYTFSNQESVTNYHLPRTGGEWLHMVEVVHMKLFMGMVLYFFLVSQIVRGSVTTIRAWESLRLRCVKDAMLKKLHHNPAEIAKSGRIVDADMRKYVANDRYFLAHMEGLKYRREALYTELLDKLGIDREAEDAEGQFLSQIRERFSMSSYLALCVEKGVIDAIEVKVSTWGAIVVIFGIFAPLHRYTEFSLRMISAMVCITSSLLLFLMWWVVRCRQNHIHNSAVSEQRMSVSPTSNVGKTGSLREHFGNNGIDARMMAAGDSHSRDFSNSNQSLGVHEKVSTEDISMLVLQILMLLMSYTFARTFLDVHNWKTDLFATGLLTSVFAVFFAILSHMLPTSVPQFLAIMALPPFVDDDNLAAFVDVLMDDHIHVEMEDSDKGWKVQISDRSGMEDDMKAAPSDRIKKDESVRSIRLQKDRFSSMHVNTVLPALTDLRGRVEALEERMDDVVDKPRGSPLDLRQLLESLDSRMRALENQRTEPGHDSLNRADTCVVAV